MRWTTREAQSILPFTSRFGILASSPPPLHLLLFGNDPKLFAASAHWRMRLPAEPAPLALPWIPVQATGNGENAVEAWANTYGKQ